MKTLEEGNVPNSLLCPGCYGEGRWEVECCSGANGCDCRGEAVDMGCCHVCNGAGKVVEGQFDKNANRRTIEGRCFIGRGPTSGYWAGK